MVAQNESARPGAARATALCTSPHGTRLHTAGGRGCALSSVEGARGARLVRGKRGGAAAACGAFWRRGPAVRAKPALARRQAVARSAPRAAPREGLTWAPYRRGVRPRGSCSRTHVKKRLDRVPSSEGYGSPGFKGTHTNFICRIIYSSRRVQRAYARA